MIKVALIDDHVLLRKSLASLVNTFDPANYEVLFEADNGKDMITKIEKGLVPDIILLDINMPVMDGYDSLDWLAKNKPHIKVMMLTMMDNEQSIIRCIRKGAKGYMIKNANPDELQRGIDELVQNDIHYSPYITKLIASDLQRKEAGVSNILQEKEIELLKLLCTEMTYKEIANAMNLSPRTIDGYRDALFEKLNVQTRVGLAMYAVRKGFIKVQD